MDNNDVIDYHADHMNDGARMKPLNLFASLNEHQRRNMVKWWMDSTPVDSFWFHRNGQPYQVKDHVNIDSDDWAHYPPTVIYVGSNGKKWARPLHDWHRSMTRNKPEDWKGKKK